MMKYLSPPMLFCISGLLYIFLIQQFLFTSSSSQTCCACTCEIEPISKGNLVQILMLDGHLLGVRGKT